jgi:hypothetical protein
LVKCQYAFTEIGQVLNAFGPKLNLLKRVVDEVLYDLKLKKKRNKCVLSQLDLRSNQIVEGEEKITLVERVPVNYV